jgi:deoxyribose-phosphate aldolase
VGLEVVMFREYNGMFPDLGWLNSVHINVPAIRLRAIVLQSRHTVKKEWQAAWLLRAITCIDLTTLGGDDTASNIARLCAKVTITCLFNHQHSQ